MSHFCEEMALPSGPVVAAFQPGDLGAPRRLCTRDELAFGGGGVIVADADHFYGHIVATGDLSGSYAVREDTELFFNAEIVRSDGILGAIGSSSLAPGHLSLGAMHAFAPLDNFGGALHGRLVLPTAIGVYQHGHPFGLDVGFTMAQPLVGRLYAHEDVTLFGQAVFGGGTGGLRGGVGVLAGVEWSAGKAFGLVGDVHAGFGYATAIDEVSIAPGFRFAGGKHFGAELSALVPVVGRARTPLAAADLRLSWRL